MALVGAGAKLSGAIPELRRLLDDLNIPTFATVHGLGAVPAESPYYLGMVGMHGTRAANMALHETDLLLVFGARLDDRVTGDPTRFAPQAKIVHFEIDPAQLDRVRACDLAVIGNLADTIPAFQAELRRHSSPCPISASGGPSLAGRSGRSSIRAGWRSRPFVFWMNSSAGCRRQRGDCRRGPAPDVGGAALPVVVAAGIHHFGRPGSDGFRSAGRGGRAAGQA